MLAIAAVIYLATALLAGRGEELAPMPPGATPTRLPARDLTGADDHQLGVCVSTLPLLPCSKLTHLFGWWSTDVDLDAYTSDLDAILAKFDQADALATGDDAVATENDPSSHEGAIVSAIE